MIRWLSCLFLAGCMTLSIAVAEEDSSEKGSEIVLALVQYEIEGNKSLEQFLTKVEAIVDEAVSSGANFIVLPELVTFDTWRVDDVESHLEPSADEVAETRRIADEITPQFMKRLQEIASSKKVFLVAGTTPRIEENQLFNTAIVCLPNGTVVLQDKLYPTHWELKAGIQPGEELQPIDADWGRFVVLTCYDVEFPDVSNLLLSVEPDLIVVPSMTESESGLQRVRWCAQARAVEHHAYVAVTGTVGNPSESWHHFGQAFIASPRDPSFPEPMQLGEKNLPSVLRALVNVDKLRSSRNNTSFNPSADARSRNSKIRVMTNN